MPRIFPTKIQWPEVGQISWAGGTALRPLGLLFHNIICYFDFFFLLKTKKTYRNTKRFDLAHQRHRPQCIASKCMISHGPPECFLLQDGGPNNKLRLGRGYRARKRLKREGKSKLGTIKNSRVYGSQISDVFLQPEDCTAPQMIP